MKSNILTSPDDQYCFLSDERTDVVWQKQYLQILFYFIFPWYGPLGACLYPCERIGTKNDHKSQLSPLEIFQKMRNDKFLLTEDSMSIYCLIEKAVSGHTVFCQMKMDQVTSCDVSLWFEFRMNVLSSQISENLRNFFAFSFSLVSH